MEKVKRYQTIISEILEELARIEQGANDAIATQLVQDQEGGHYLLFYNGWQGKKRIYGCYLHIDLASDGKVWLQYDGTDRVVGQLLLDKGVSKDDLVLGFHHPLRRVDTGFAVA